MAKLQPLPASLFPNLSNEDKSISPAGLLGEAEDLVWSWVLRNSGDARSPRVGGNGQHQVIGAEGPAHNQFPHQVPGGRDRAQAGTPLPQSFSGRR